MHPQICQIGPLTIYSYGLMMALAFLTSVSLAGMRARKEGIDPEVIFNVALQAMIWGVVGARAFYVLENLSEYLSNPREIIMLQHGGLSWFGGFIAGSGSVLIYLKKKKLKVITILDLIVPFLALGQSIGRIGCLLNGCCYGRPSELGIYFPVHGAELIPTQLYSSLFLIVIFVILRIIQERPHQAGKIFFAYLLLYSLKRFLIEFWRADNPGVLWGLTLFQVLSIIMFCAGLCGFFFLRKRKI
ncbi:MAG: prolipoprotein diacylglyceryl transferase [Candidatus Omnitrophica bacterium]|nr:prolipoprotein diacylglyceryl transferase [Candidatus Omnitrophota bacterium]MDD5513162.1 prolipoprotein diacylglyceryl transferase [Candidatus Omnitrophota bacterium]